MTRKPERPYIEQALTHLAAYFAGVARGAHDQADEQVRQISNIDLKARSQLNPSEYETYITRRKQLLSLFGRRVVFELRGQVEEEVLERTQELIAAFDKWEQE